MDLDQIKGALNSALPLRFPQFEEDESARNKVSAIGDYLLEVAYRRGELEEALLGATRLVEYFKDRIEHMEEGWEAFLPAKAVGKITRADVLTAKRQVAPQFFELGTEARQLKEAILRQIARFEFEETTISRAYTVISGS